MNIRKHLKNLLLTTTALFWASCSSENDSTFPTIGQDTPPAVDPGASSDSNIESSSENAAESSSSDAVASSSSEANAPSSSSTEQSSSSAVTCSPNLDKFFSVSKADRYSIDNAAPDASSQAKFDANRKITAIRDSLSKDTPKCLKDMQEDLERNFVAVYGAPYANRLPAEETCSDGTTRPTKEYLEQQKFDEEQAKKKPQYDEKYNEVYKEETEKFNKKINDCLGQ